VTGEPTYIELGVPDADAARTFYGAVLGWQPSGASGPGQVETQTLDIGVHDGDDERHFEVFFAVDDLESALGQVTERGGSITSEVHETPGFGRWVECADDQGVRFGLRQPSAG
jgi:predicted enzyme related to lactoylglutathione lyase